MTRKRKEQAGQRELNWLRGSQRRALRGLAAEISASIAPVLLASDGGGVKPAAAVNVLDKIDDHAGARGACWASIETLARESGYSVRHAKRILEVMDREGLITQTWETVGGKRTMCRRIVWANVLPEDFVEPDRERADSKTGVQTTDGHGAMAQGQSAMVSNQSAMVSKDTYIGSATEAPSPPLPPAPLPPDWVQVFLELQEIGAEFPGEALKSARRAGVSIQEVRDRVAFWQGEQSLAGWGVQTLVYSIEKSVPGQRVDKGWPTRKRKPGVGVESLPEVAVNSGGQVNRETDWGWKLDQLAGDQAGLEVLWRMLEGASGCLASWARKCWAKDGQRVWHRQAVRTALLRAIEAEYKGEAIEPAAAQPGGQAAG